MQAMTPPSRIKRHRLLSLLGSTPNSFVYVATVPGGSQKIAIKLVHHKVASMDRIENECSIQRVLKHLYIMPLHEVFDYMDFRAMVMPRAIGGSLYEWVDRRKQKSPQIVGKILYRLFKAVQYMHALRILHGDIKPANVVLDSADSDEPVPLMIDFGHACNLSLCKICSCRLMTCSYSSPELLALKPHGLPSDIWSLGATTYAVIYGKELVKVRALEVMQKEVSNLRLSFDDRVSSSYPTSMRSMISGMLKRTPEDRLNIDACLAHGAFVDLLGEEWIAKENDTVKFLSGRHLREGRDRVKALAKNRLERSSSK